MTVSRRRPDARLLVGLGLVAASVAGVVGLVAAVDRRIPAYAAAEPLEPGAVLEPGRLVERQVALDGSEGLYLLVGQLPAEGLVVTRPIREGELVPTAALGEAAGLDLTSIVVRPAAEVSGRVAPGALVDLWTAAEAEDGLLTAPPSVLVPDAIVVSVVSDAGFASSGRAAAVELLVPRARVARLLQAIADDSSLAVVPAGLPWTAP